MLSEKTILIILFATLVAVVIYFQFYAPSGKKEGFLAAGGMDHLGAILPDGRVKDYEIISQSQENASVYPSLDDTLAGSDFAALVDSGDQAVQASTFVEESRPLERLQNLTDSYFPTVASKALPFSQAAAKPLYHHHAVNLPRINLKGKLFEMNLAEAIRGTVPINYDPNVSVISASQYRNEDVFNPGYMTTAFNSLHNKLTGGYKNLPMYLAGGVGGVEVILDA